MKYERTKEGYALYLKSDHWKTFRREVLKRDKCRCQECRKFGWQVHHKLYRDDWESAQLGDCVTLCRKCHEKQHGIAPKNQPAVVLQQRVPMPQWMDAEPATKKQLMQARSKKLISKAEFHRLRSKLKSEGLWWGRIKGSPKKKWKKIHKKKLRQACVTWVYSKPRQHYVNRGTSSN